MKKIIITILFSILASFCFAETVRDSCNRIVDIPDNINKVAPCGAPATMIMECIAPEKLCCVSTKPAGEQLKDLPVTGNLYGGKSTINKEELLSTGAQIIIEMGEYKKGIEEELDNLQKQLGIPCIFIQADIINMAEGIRALGKILRKENRANEVADFIDRIVNRARNNAANIKKSEVVSVLYTGNADGLGVNAKGSSNSQVLDLIGAENAYSTKKISNKFNGNQINMEILYSINPDVIVFAPNSYFNYAKTDKSWCILPAVKNNKIYEVPAEPYNWLSSPSSINMILGIIWLGNIVYPQYNNYNLDNEIREACRVLWNITDTN